MDFFDVQDFFGSLTKPVRIIDEVLFGPPGECSGLLGTPVAYAIENPGKTLAIAATAAVTGGVGLAAAGPLAASLGGAGLLGVASTGTTISTLSGVALTNASLASIGGGALAAGGGGMTAGASVIGGVSAVSGAAISAGVVTRKRSRSRK